MGAGRGKGKEQGQVVVNLAHYAAVHNEARQGFTVAVSDKKISQSIGEVVLEVTIGCVLTSHLIYSPVPKLSFCICIRKHIVLFLNTLAPPTVASPCALYHPHITSSHHICVAPASCTIAAVQVPDQEQEEGQVHNDRHQQCKL